MRRTATRAGAALLALALLGACSSRPIPVCRGEYQPFNSAQICRPAAG